MRHPKLPKKLYNRLIINLGNLFVQKCDEVKGNVRFPVSRPCPLYMVWFMDASYLILPQPRKGVANYFLLVKVTRGIASFASLIRSSPRYVAGTPKGVLQYLKEILIGLVFL